MHTGHQPATPVNAANADVLKHLADSLHTRSRRYRKQLRRCQRRFSEEAVHDSRVETRRLLAIVELLCAFLPDREVQKARRALKRHLDTFDQLRDTQVQLVYVGRMTRIFPAARAFHSWLQQREARFTRKTCKAVKHIKTRRLARRIACFEKEICRQRKRLPRARAFEIAMREINQAFARVVQLCRRVKAANTATIHRTRVAFKRFRYMVEALSPLLPAIIDEHRNAMRGYQSLMGDIQDSEVLLAALDKFIHDEEIKSDPARQLREELLRRRQWLIRVYLNAAGKLRGFWPRAGLAGSIQPRKRER
jgi:CHAD domain-containing protein